MIKRYESFFFFFVVLFCSNNTLWGSLKEPNIVNTNEFEDLFSKATLQPKKKPLSDTYEKKAKAKKVKLVASHFSVGLEFRSNSMLVLKNSTHCENVQFLCFC